MHLVTVIILWGTSASGKSTTADALEERLARPFLALELDAFIDSFPRRARRAYRRVLRATNPLL